MPDAPDWQRTVTGPGAEPLSSPYPTTVATAQQSGAVTLTTAPQEIVSLTCANPAGTIVLVTAMIHVQLTSTLASDYISAYLSLDGQVLEGFGAQILQPGVVVNDAQATFSFMAWFTTPAPEDFYAVYASYSGSPTVANVQSTDSNGTPGNINVAS